jgi:hypothetical protein
MKLKLVSVIGELGCDRVVMSMTGSLGCRLANLKAAVTSSFDCHGVARPGDLSRFMALL